MRSRTKHEHDAETNIRRMLTRFVDVSIQYEDGFYWLVDEHTGASKCVGTETPSDEHIERFAKNIW